MVLFTFSMEGGQLCLHSSIGAAMFIYIYVMATAIFIFKTKKVLQFQKKKHIFKAVLHLMGICSRVGRNGGSLGPDHIF